MWLVERVGEAFELGEKLTVVGARLERGVRAPEFELDRLVPDTGTLETVRLSDSNGKVRILNIVNSCQFIGHACVPGGDAPLGRCSAKPTSRCRSVHGEHGPAFRPSALVRG